MDDAVRLARLIGSASDLDVPFDQSINQPASVRMRVVSIRGSLRRGFGEWLLSRRPTGFM